MEINFQEESADIWIVKNKKNGFVRDGPQCEPNGRKVKQKFTCKKCDVVLESQGLMDAHVVAHQEQLLKYLCTQCDSKFKTITDLKTYIGSEHVSKEIEFNCYNCSFQGTTELKK